MAKINEDWLDIDTSAIAIVNRKDKSATGNSPRTLAAIIAYTELEVTKRVQQLPNSYISDDIELDDDGYYKSIILQQFATNYCLYRIMLSYIGSGKENTDDVYSVKASEYKKICDTLLPEITSDTVNNDGTEAVEEAVNGFMITY